jgi:hypothetical protein
MAVSSEKLAADRETARKSTGPTSPEGKATVRLDALKHGLLARDVVLPEGGEDPAEFDALLSELDEHYAPVGPIEIMLVQRIAVARWRMGRAQRSEGGTARRQLIEVQSPENAGRHFKAHAQELKRRAARVEDLRKKVEQMEPETLELTETEVKELGWDREVVQAGLMELELCDRKPSLLSLLDDKRTEFLEQASRAEARADQLRAEAVQVHNAKKVEAVLPLHDRALRYETTLERQFYRAMDELEKRQRNRRQMSNKEASAPQSV